jgi:hypothetical protein
METSERIKRNQNNPPEVLGQPDSNQWLVAGTGDTHLVTRISGHKWVCSCPTSGCCRHIESAAIDAAKQTDPALRLSFWTKKVDAIAQRRAKKDVLEFESVAKVVKVTVKGQERELNVPARTFWVTVRRVA